MKPVVLMILDGFGYSDSVAENAIAAANTPNLDRIFDNCPNVLISTSGLDVGLPDGQMGNSEVGHTNIGAGRIVFQELTRITNSIETGEFFDNPALIDAAAHVTKNKSSLHLIGLVSDGGVHSHSEHISALVELAKRSGVERLYVHCILDGRDVPPKSGIDFVKKLSEHLDDAGLGSIATVMGRYYAMDRDNRWDRVEKAYAAMVRGEGERCNDPLKAIELSYQSGVTDEFMLPVICLPEGTIKDKDSIIFFNFRPDRAREITRAFVDRDFSGFARKEKLSDLYYVCLTEYDETIENVYVAFPPKSLNNTLGEYISEHGLSQLRIAETEKYAHVTFFFNGGEEKIYKNEERCLIASPNVSTYDLQPEMSAYLVTDELVKRINSGKYDIIIVNYANCDMVGHTGIFEAAKSAVEAVDKCVGDVVKAVESNGGVILLTADHGNAEKMIEADGTPFTAHTNNQVPFAVIGHKCKLREGGKLADIAPTVLNLLELPVPTEMEGTSIII